jgi:hypothetical protein
MSPVLAAQAPRRDLLTEESYFDPQSRSDDPLVLIWTRLLEASHHFLSPVSRHQTLVAELFAELKEQWKTDTEFLSSTDAIALHSSYQGIIALGREVLPFLLRDVEGGEAQWFWALRAITRIDPVDPRHRGDRKLMAYDWLRWAREEGIRW